jgi:nucleoside-diphosphate-sugar epimerase
MLAPDKKIIFNGKYRQGDLRNSLADIKKAKNILNWQNKISIDNGIELYCQYIKDNLEKFKTIDTCAKEDEKLKKFYLYK